MKNKPFDLWGFVLFPISLFLLYTTAWIGVLYAIVSLPLKMSFKSLIKRWNQYFFILAVSIDQLGNVVMQDFFNDLLINQSSPHRFGHEDETISSVLGRNKSTNTLSKTGRALVNFLDRIDPNHVLNSIEHRC